MDLFSMSCSLCRYAFDAHSNRAEDILMHMKLLQQVRSPAYQPAFEIRAAQVLPF